MSALPEAAAAFDCAASHHVRTTRANQLRAQRLPLQLAEMIRKNSYSIHILAIVQAISRVLSSRYNPTHPLLLYYIKFQ